MPAKEQEKLELDNELCQGRILEGEYQKRLSELDRQCGEPGPIDYALNDPMNPPAPRAKNYRGFSIVPVLDHSKWVHLMMGGFYLSLGANLITQPWRVRDCIAEKSIDEYWKNHPKEQLKQVEPKAKGVKPMKLKKTFRTYMMMATIWTTFCILRAANPLVVLLAPAIQRLCGETIPPATWMVWFMVIFTVALVMAILWAISLLIAWAYSAIWD